MNTRSSCFCPRMIGRSRRASLRRTCRSGIGRMGRLRWGCALHKFRCPVCRKSSTLRFRQPSPRRSRNSNYFGRKVRSGTAGRWSTKFQRSPSVRIQIHALRSRIPTRCHRYRRICQVVKNQISSTESQLRTRRSRFVQARIRVGSCRTSCSWPSPHTIVETSSKHLQHTSLSHLNGNSPSPSYSFRLHISNWSMPRNPPCIRSSLERPPSHCSNNTLCISRIGTAGRWSTKFQRSPSVRIQIHALRSRIPTRCHRYRRICQVVKNQISSTESQLRTRRSRFVQARIRVGSCRTSCSWPSPHTIVETSSKHLQHTSLSHLNGNSPSPSYSFRPGF